MNKPIAILILSCAAATAQEFPEIRWLPWISGLDNPVDIQHAGDGTGRLFVVEQIGRIMLIKNGQLVVEPPVLNIGARVMSGGEMGLLGLAFPPNFRQKQYFYVNYTDRQRRTIVSRFRMQGDIADLTSEQILLTIPQPFTNHNGGQIVFSPRDGHLYIGMGDGGSGGDPQKNAQNPNSLLGKMLRFDVEGGAEQPTIWASGLRNPWRFSFDRETHDLYIGDVGQSQREEVDFEPANSQGGRNYGWSLMEGTNCFDDRDCAQRTDLARPIFEYGRNDGGSITGGHVYRGSAFPGLRGVYIFGDYVSRQIFALRRNGDRWESRRYGDSGVAMSTFGVDEAGEMYMADHTRGRILRLASDAVPFAVTSAVNGASFSGPIAAGGVGTLFTGPIPGVSTTIAAAGYPLPATLGGVTVRVNGTPAPLYAVTSTTGSGQINIQMPRGAVGPVPVVVNASGQSAPEVTLNVVPIAPGIFQSAGVAAALRASDYSVVSGTNPAVRGETILIYATGLGPVSNAPADGAAAGANPLSEVVERVTVTIGGVAAPVSFGGLAPGFAGLYQVNAQVPAGLPAGTAELILRSGSAVSPPAPLPVR